MTPLTTMHPSFRMHQSKTCFLVIVLTTAVQGIENAVEDWKFKEND